MNQNQIESLKLKIEETFPLEGLSFNLTTEKNTDGINYLILERYNYRIKIIYVFVPLESNMSFNKFKELESITNYICNDRDANFGCFGTCYFEGNDVINLSQSDHQIERLKKTSP